LIVEPELALVSPDSSDPSVVSLIAVALEDVIAALETNATTSKQAVLRLTPPFSGRMRARLHVDQGKPYEPGPTPVQVPPERLLADDAPGYPRPADTEDALRADPDEAYTVERHRERHAEAVAAWRQSTPEAIRDEVSLQAPDGPQQVIVTTLGDPPSGPQNGK
jgi:hypothetical protein